MVGLSGVVQGAIPAIVNSGSIQSRRLSKPRAIPGMVEDIEDAQKIMRWKTLFPNKPLPARWPEDSEDWQRITALAGTGGSNDSYPFMHISKQKQI